MNNAENLLKLHKLYLYALQAREEYEDKYGDTRTINMLIFKVWDFTQYADRVPDNGLYSLEPIVMFSRDSGERIDLSLNYPKRGIEELEQIAVEFGRWADKNIKHIIE